VLHGRQRGARRQAAIKGHHRRKAAQMMSVGYPVAGGVEPLVRPAFCSGRMRVSWCHRPLLPYAQCHDLFPSTGACSGGACCRRLPVRNKPAAVAATCCTTTVTQQRSDLSSCMHSCMTALSTGGRGTFFVDGRLYPHAHYLIRRQTPWTSPLHRHPHRHAHRHHHPRHREIKDQWPPQLSSTRWRPSRLPPS